MQTDFNLKIAFGTEAVHELTMVRDLTELLHPDRPGVVL